MKSLDIPQQMWLQSLIASRFMSEVHAKALHKAAMTACSMTYLASEYDSFFSKVAKAVAIVDLEIRRTVDETKGTHVVGLVNTKGDEIAQMATTLNPREMTFVKKMIKRIIKAPHEAFCLGSKEALDIAARLNPVIPASRAEAICNKLVRHGWFRLSRAGRYSLTPRTLMELQNYLQNTYEDYVLTCTACEELLTHGSACSNVECDVRVHRHCMLNWESSLKNGPDGKKACSHCKAAWETIPVGEAILFNRHSDVRQTRASATNENTDEAGEEEAGSDAGGAEEEGEGEEVMEQTSERSGTVPGEEGNNQPAKRRRPVVPRAVESPDEEDDQPAKRRSRRS